MAHNHDILDLQNVDRIFERCTHTVKAAIRLVGRHQIGDVAYDKQLPRRRVEYVGRFGTAVGTGDQHNVGVLAFAKFAIQAGLLCIGTGAKPPIARNQVINRFHVTLS